VLKYFVPMATAIVSAIPRIGIPKEIIKCVENKFTRRQAVGKHYLVTFGHSIFNDTRAHAIRIFEQTKDILLHNSATPEAEDLEPNGSISSPADEITWKVDNSHEDDSAFQVFCLFEGFKGARADIIRL